MDKNINIKDIDESTMDTMIDVFNTINFVRNYPNDQVVKDISAIMSNVFKLINAMSNTDLIDIVERGLQSPELDKALLNPPRMGMVKLMNTMRDEDVQRGLGIMVELLRAIGRASKELK